MNRHDRRSAQRRASTLKGADAVTEVARGFVKILQLVSAGFLPLLLKWALAVQCTPMLGVLLVRQVLAATAMRMFRRMRSARVKPMPGVLLVTCCPRTGPPAAAVADCTGAAVIIP